MKRIKKMTTPILMMGVIVWCLMACEKMTLPEHEGEANSSLQVRTRIGEGSEGAVISYPVYVYVFKSEKCVALQTISNETQSLNIQLAEGTYSVYAIGGASENYVLPTQETATPSMAITLKEGKTHGDLMMAKSNVTLVDGGTNTLTLGLERKIMELKSVVLNKIPSAATAVSVTISPLWQQLEGITYAEQEGEATITLTKQENERIWTLTNTQYLLPPSGNTLTIAVNIVTPNGTNTYTYNSAEVLEAAGKFNIQGTYTEAVGVTLTGTITGATWKSEKTISFEFNESGSQTADTNTGNESGNDNNTGNDNNNNNDDDIITGTIPTVGSTYQTCYVLAVTDKGSYSEVLLLSPTQETAGIVDKEDPVSAITKVEAIIPNCTIEGISGWRIMTDTEANLIINVTTPKVPNLSSTYRYFYLKDGVLKSSKLSGWSLAPGNLNSTDLLRPVTTIKMKASE